MMLGLWGRRGRGRRGQWSVCYAGRFQGVARPKGPLNAAGCMVLLSSVPQKPSHDALQGGSGLFRPLPPLFLQPPLAHRLLDLGVKQRRHAAIVFESFEEFLFLSSSGRLLRWPGRVRS